MQSNPKRRRTTQSSQPSDTSTAPAPDSPALSSSSSTLPPSPLPSATINQLNLPIACQSACSHIYSAPRPRAGIACVAIIQSAAASVHQPAVTAVYQPAVSVVQTVPAALVLTVSAVAQPVPALVVPVVPAPVVVQPAAAAAAQATGLITDPVKSYQLNWSKVDNYQQIRPYLGPAVGPTFNDPTSTPLSIFLKIFDNEVWQLIVTHTNTYANWIRACEPEKHKGSWKDVTVEELMRYIGLVIAMGILKFPRVDYYWKMKYTTIMTTGISDVMPRNRFMAISRYFHVCDKANEPARDSLHYDKLYKIRSFSDLLARKHQPLYNIGPEVTIDEAMVPFKGRIGFKQYIKTNQQSGDSMSGH
ncbi:uncharacterized protein LOC134188414 [Corticium candelabrum]|uniref:uncharacterized protein LOC134188414 n=1 Tax=Corticium candelabrum TaxID=121492 RepID=UPI002E25A32A|nr:uncharacterized protein LOC134188414 [Corticium candelabrum]